MYRVLVCVEVCFLPPSRSVSCRLHLPPVQVRELVEEMKRHCAEFMRVASKEHELDKFWLRKTKKPVLSVLMVKKLNEPAKFFRGINMEVRFTFLTKKY